MGTLPADARAKLLRENTARLYGIPVPSAVDKSN
jgi:hypothetical protein